MQVLSPFYVNSPSFISTIHLTDSSLLLSSSFANISNKHKNVANDIAVLNACTPISNFQRWFDTCLYNSAFQKSCNDFMYDDNTMAATNSKRYLQNKLGDRKRRRPDSVRLETSEIEINDTSTRSRQATRQSVKNNLKPATTTLEKSNKTEKSILSISGSKKQLRSSGNHDIEQFCDYKKFPSRSSPTNCHENEGVDELLSSKSDIHSTTYQRASDNFKNYINKLENQKKFDIEEDRNPHNHYMEQEVSGEDETKKNNDSNSSSIILREQSFKKMYQTNTASVNDNTATLDYENMNSGYYAYSPSSSGLIAETHCTTDKLNCILEEKSLLGDVNNIKEVTTTPLGEKDSSMSPCPPLNRVNDDNKTQEDYENHLSRISNSMCSDNSFSSNSCCKDSIDNSGNRTPNESKPNLEDTNQTKSTNLSINQLQMSSINSQKENNNNDDKNYECAIKSQSVYNMTMQASDVSNSYLSKTIKSAKLDKIHFGQKVNAAVLVTDTIEYSKENSDKQEKKDNRPAYFEKSLIREGSNNTRQINDEYKGLQQLTAEKIPNHQQLEDNIINATDKLYTEIEYDTNNQQQNIASISSRYGQLNNNQQTSQQDRDCDAHHQGHDIRLSHQQDPQQQQHSIHQQQQPYANVHLYQLQQQQEHHQQLPIEHHHQIHNEIKLQQHHHNISQDTQRETRQLENAHFMEFLQPEHHHSSTNMQSPLHQQQQLQPHQHQIHEVYHDLMMDEFHDDHHTPYKLGLSPSTVKHENQDDGYETSAGDVLTPNSHTSSTHSVTPQLHLHHVTSCSGFTPNGTKSGEEQHHQQQQNNIHLQQSQHNCNLINEQTIQQENESARNLTPRDTYHFIDDDLNSPNNNNSLRNILTSPHSHSHSQPRVVNQEARKLNNFLGMQSEVHSNILNSASEMYGLTKSAVNHLSQKQIGAETISATATITNSNHQQQHFIDIESEMVATHAQDSISNLQTKSIQKKRGRKKKITPGETLSILERTSLNDLDTAARYLRAKERKKHDRFNGMSEEEIVKRILPDHLCENLDIVIIGINPGLFAAYKGHHYAGPGNHFWKCLYLSGLTQEQMSADEDFKLIKYGIGFTNMVQRATKGSADLTRKEIKEGSRILLEKLQRFRPKIAVFNGKLIFEVFSGKKDFNFGRQPECVEGTDTFIWVMPSSSARCAQLPRAAHKVPFYAALKKFRDYLNGLVPHIEQSECVFTEERIKQQCEQQNYKNQQNNMSDEASVNFSNTVGICNTGKLLQSNTFDSESSPHGAGRGPDPSQSSTRDSTANTSFMMSSLVGTHEKKKRGRPKKIKEQEVVDTETGNKIRGNSQILTPGNGKFNSILNLSMAQVPNSEVPKKKKRGRPKKLKLPTNILQKIIVHSSPMLSQTPNILSIHSMTSDVIQSSPHHIQGIQQSHQQTSIYSTPPHQHQRNIYSPIVSPMASPSLNCSYTTNTPPSNQNHDKLVLNGNEKASSETTREVLVTTQHSINEQNFCKSPSAPNSPNICAVDFNPSTAASTATSSLLIISDSVHTGLNTIHHQRLQNCQKARFNSQNSSEVTPDHNSNTEHFQQWLSPQHNHGVPTPTAATLVSNTTYSNLPQHESLNYHDQQHAQVIQQQQHQQEIHTQWALRHKSRYDDSPYLLSSFGHPTQPHSHESNHQQQQNHCGSDVARKSLSGLESLVDQIPAISESESIALSSASAVNAQVVAAAAVENRLQGMQNSSHNDSQIGDDSNFSTITRSSNLLTVSSSPTSATSTNNPMQQSNTSTSLLNNNFSVRNLAASSASSNNIGNINNQENYGISSDSRPLSNTNGYHHTNIMAAAVLAAAAANSPTTTTPTESSTATHHAQMYMDSQAHLMTHVPINTIYPATAAATHHHHSAVASAHHHHTAAVHYNNASYAPTEYTTNNIYTSSQSNVAAGHTLHMPSPNYPYGYSTASSQSNYTTYPHTHANHHHGHPHTHHTAHHLGMFDRLKPSDITGYSSGF